MSKSGGGGCGGGGAVAVEKDRVRIPENVRKTIQRIREITGKQHSDEDIYSVLRDCSMDPNETAQKLLYLDTFHEVKRKHRKKETSSTRGRGARGSRGNNSSNYISSDAVGGRNATSRRETGFSHMTERVPSTSSPVTQKTNNDASPAVTEASVVRSNGPSGLPNGNSSVPPAILPPASDQISNSNTLPTSISPASVSGVNSSASDTVLAPNTTHYPDAVESQQKASEQNENAASKIVNSMNSKKATGRLKAPEKIQFSEPPQPSSILTHEGSSGTRSPSCDGHSQEELVIPMKVVSSEDGRAKASFQSLPELTVPNGHVTFPNHFKVPEALKSGLTFGSFDANSGLGTKYSNGDGCDINSPQAIESSHGTDETAREVSSSFSHEGVFSTVHVDHSSKTESPHNVLEEVPQSEGNFAPNDDSKVDQSKQEVVLVPEGHQNPPVQIPPNYGFGIMPPVQGGHLVQFNGHEAQAQDVSRLSSFVSENPTASSSLTPTPTLTPVQNSVAASPQTVYFRPPYPPNYFPYGPYFPPYFLSMHQLLSHNGLPHHLSTGNTFLTPAASAPGVKFPPQFKAGTSTGNPTPNGLPASYGSYSSPPIGFNPGPAVTSASSANKEDLSASQLKESGIYTTGPLSEVSAWTSPPGQDISGLQFNSFYHLPSQGQHLTFSPAQVGHAPFPGVYPPVQTMPAPSTVNPLLQQSQAMSAAVETVGPPSGTYQQPQLAQIDWNSSF